MFSDKNFDPINLLVHVEKFPELVAELFDTASSPEMSIPSSSDTLQPNDNIRKEDCLTFHREVHQASVDFGLRFREF